MLFTSYICKRVISKHDNYKSYYYTLIIIIIVVFLLALCNCLICIAMTFEGVLRNIFATGREDDTIVLSYPCVAASSQNSARYQYF